jgi:hypothetical protein
MDRSVTLEQKTKLSVEPIFDQLLETHISSREEVPSLCVCADPRLTGFLTWFSDWHHEATKLSPDVLYPCPDTAREVLAPVQGATNAYSTLVCVFISEWIKRLMNFGRL